MLKPDDLYEATNGGLDIIISYYPDAEKSINKKSPFKVRNESTPSAYLKEFKGIWKVTDFGDDSKARSAIDVCMLEDSLTFSEALYRLAERYNIQVGLNSNINKPHFDKRPATESEPDGNFAFELNDKFTDFELKVLGPKVKQEHCDNYGYSSVKWYSRTKDRKTTIVNSTEHYPIFMRECTYDKADKTHSFRKFYQPLNVDKSFRFFYHGEKQPDYINGLAELKEACLNYTSQQEHDFSSNKANEGKPFKPRKIDEAIIACGERDALNVASFGYFPIWFNSETVTVTERDYKSISSCVERVYNIPDIDNTGIKKGTELAMQFIDLHTVWLPEWLRTYKDMRGKPRKDLRDYVELRPNLIDFKNLLKIAMPVKFWEYRLFEKGYKYEINTEYVYHFLKINGFSTIEDKNSKSGLMFIRVQNNIVKEIKSKDIRAFIKHFVDSRYFEIEIRNLVNNTTRLNESTLESLKQVEINFSDFDKNKQYFFFENKTWEITANGIHEFKPNEVNNFVWDEEVIKNKVKRTTEAFTVTEDYDILVNHHESHYFEFLINASRIFWRSELEQRISTHANPEQYAKDNKFKIDGELLTEKEINEQKNHLLNKIFCIGYLLHRYKDPSRSWCIFAMDNKIGEVGDSNGRTGKSFAFKALRKFMKSVTLSGRNPKLTENPHIYERVTEYTDLVLVDDGDEYLNFDFFFDVVTGDMPVNPKNNKSYEIPFDKAPKFCITSNFTLRKIDDSTSGRILYSVFSDYYHQKTENNDYRETRTIFDDFGKNLFYNDYTEEEWNADFNFFADCCRFYLSTIGANVKIQPPLENVTIRSLMTIMGSNFKDWADVFFSPDGDKVNTMVPRDEALSDFLRTSNIKGWSTQKFTKALKAFCSVAQFVHRLNPAEFKNAQGRIIRKGTDNKSHEMIYIQTIGTEIDYSLISEKPDGNAPLPF